MFIQPSSGQVDCLSFRKVSGSNFKSVGHFGGGQEIAVARLATAHELRCNPTPLSPGVTGCPGSGP